MEPPASLVHDPAWLIRRRAANPAYDPRRDNDTFGHQDPAAILAFVAMIAALPASAADYYAMILTEVSA